ncbi:MAG: hypothetical protein R3F65_33430 [bacterium]
MHAHRSAGPLDAITRMIPYAILMASLALTACDDPASTSGDPAADAAPDNTQDMGAPTPDAAPPPLDLALPPDAARPDPAFIELGLDPAPASGLYTRADHPRSPSPSTTASSRPSAPPTCSALRRAAPGIATLDDTRTLTFVAEGQGAVRGCVTSQLCGRVSFYVDDAPPSLELTTPARGDIVSGDPVIEVTGRTDPAPGTPRVFVNDAEVPVAPDGSFTATLRATLGLNRIDVLADDSVRRPGTRVVREVVWAPEVIAPDPDGVTIPDALVLRLDQRLLDLGIAPPAPDEEGAQTVSDLAGLVELFLARIEPLGLIGDPVISDSAELTLTIEDITPGLPDASITLVEGGLEVFLRLEDLTVRTAGRVSLEGEVFDLGGEIRVTAAAYAGVRVEPGPDGAPVLVVGDIGVAIEALGGTMNDSTAQALVDTLGSLVRTVLDAFAADLVEQLVAEQVPEFIELGLGDALEPLAAIPLEVEDPPIALDVGFTLTDPRITRDALTLSLTGRVSQRAPVEPPYPSPGIPAVGVDADPIWPVGAGLGVAVRLAVVNALLDAVWRQGALQLDLAGFLPDELSALLTGGRVDARIAPLVVPGARGGPYAFELQVGELDLYLESIRNPDPDHYVLSVRAGLILQIDDGRDGGAPRVRFDIAESPDIRASLIQAGGRSPILPPASLAAAIEGAAWPQVREAIGEGLDLALDPIAIDVAAFAELAPSIMAVEVQPLFPAPPAVRNGWFTLGASVDLTVR